MWIYAFWGLITLLIVVAAFFECDCPSCTTSTYTPEELS